MSFLYNYVSKFESIDHLDPTRPAHPSKISNPTHGSATTDRATLE